MNDAETYHENDSGKCYDEEKIGYDYKGRNKYRSKPRACTLSEFVATRNIGALIVYGTITAFILYFSGDKLRRWMGIKPKAYKKVDWRAEDNDPRTIPRRPSDEERSEE